MRTEWQGRWGLQETRALEESPVRWDCQVRWGCREWRDRRDLQDCRASLDPREGRAPRERGGTWVMWVSREPRVRKVTVGQRELGAGKAREDTEVRQELQDWTLLVPQDLTVCQFLAVAGTEGVTIHSM